MNREVQAKKLLCGLDGQLLDKIGQMVIEFKTSHSFRIRKIQENTPS